MYKACSKCGKIHPSSFICNKERVYSGGDERQLRSKYVWTKKSREIRDKAHNLCEACKANGVYVYDNIEVHHIVKVRDDKNGLLDNNNLICLCQECHKKADKGQIDSGYLRALAENREKE